MARRRRSTRRRSLRSFGAVLVNPGKRRRRRNPPLGRKAAQYTSGGLRFANFPVRIPKSGKSYTRAGKPVRAYRRRKAAKTRRPVIRGIYKTTKRKSTRRKSAQRSLPMKSNPRRRRRVSMRRRRPSVLRQSRRKSRRARRNPAFISTIQSSLRKIPVVGGVSAKVVGFAPHAIIGAAAVEVPLQIQKMDWWATSRVGAWFADKPEWLFVASGAALALLTQYLPANIASAATKQRVAIAVAAAGAGAGWLKYSETKRDMGALTLGALSAGYTPIGALPAGYGPPMGAVGAYGEGPAYTVSPMGSSYGAVVLGG